MDIVLFYDVINGVHIIFQGCLYILGFSYKHLDVTVFLVHASFLSLGDITNSLMMLGGVR